MYSFLDDIYKIVNITTFTFTVLHYLLREYQEGNVMTGIRDLYSPHLKVFSPFVY